MDLAPRKRGRPKLFLTKEMVEERKMLKRFRNNSRRNSHVEDGSTTRCPGSSNVGSADGQRIFGGFEGASATRCPGSSNVGSTDGQRFFGGFEGGSNMDCPGSSDIGSDEGQSISKGSTLCGDTISNEQQKCGDAQAEGASGRGNGPEGYSICCGKGKVQLPLLRDTPPELLELSTSGGRISRNFLTKIRVYNNIFAFCSYGRKVDDSVNKGKGPYVFQVSGETYHNFSSLVPLDGCTPKFAQIYMYVGQEAIDHRVNFVGSPDGLDPAIVKTLQDMLNRDNTLVGIFKQAQERFYGVDQDFTKNSVLGRVLAVVYTIEFQKCGLPHAHIVLWFAGGEKLLTPEHIDELICAEIPDEVTDPIGYKAVSQFMMHGPCGAANPKCPCMSKGRCTKYFPKPFRDETTMDNDGYALYRRRDTKRTVECNKILLDNRHVVPYHRGLFVKYQAHVNVEWCNRSLL
ncbi:hypothetical protein POM88_054474 [Heracleum sosnowskyi]|uniref:Helitron helicase-like domain-containing protein n=1 Tax=Heracleum sosnowskyi TaxID=360622 RepID=A0AAD8GNI0_9APIA|nr:hypothetical protein POM88_054474 [Heracleum sosnowskyi]